MAEGQQMENENMLQQQQQQATTNLLDAQQRLMATNPDFNPNLTGQKRVNPYSVQGDQRFPRQDGTIDMGTLKIRNVGSGDTQNMASVDNTILDLRKKIYAKAGKDAGQKQPKAKYQAMSEVAKDKKFEEYRKQLIPYNTAALTMAYQPTLKSLADGVSQAYNTFADKLGGVKPDSLIFLTQIKDPQTGAFRPFSKKTAVSALGMKLQEMQQKSPRDFAAVRVLLSWNRFVRSVTNFYRWANFTENMTKRANTRATIRQKAAAPIKLLQTIQRKSKKLGLKGQSLTQAVKSIKDARALAITNFEDKIKKADEAIERNVTDTNNIQYVQENQ